LAWVATLAAGFVIERICLGKIRGIEGRMLRSRSAGRLMKDMGEKRAKYRRWQRVKWGRRTPMKPGVEKNWRECFPLHRDF